MHDEQTWMQLSDEAVGLGLVFVCSDLADGWPPCPGGMPARLLYIDSSFASGLKRPLFFSLGINCLSPIRITGFTKNYMAPSCPRWSLSYSKKAGNEE